MKTGREAFEIWWKSIYRIPGEDMGVAWQAWQASRKVALEDSTEICKSASCANKSASDCYKKIKELSK